MLNLETWKNASKIVKYLWSDHWTIVPLDHWFCRKIGLMINKQPFSSVSSILTRLSKFGIGQFSQKYYCQHSTIRIKESAYFSKSSMSRHNGVTFSVLIKPNFEIYVFLDHERFSAARGLWRCCLLLLLLFCCPLFHDFRQF